MEGLGEKNVANDPERSPGLRAISSIRTVDYNDDEQLLAAFEAREICLADWCHEYHVRVGFIYLELHGFEEALRRMRYGIRENNRSKGITDAIDSGYHETMTNAWLRLIDASRREDKMTNSVDFWRRYADLRDKALLRRYYTSDRIMTVRAKLEYVEPDIHPLPT